MNGIIAVPRVDAEPESNLERTLYKLATEMENKGTFTKEQILKQVREAGVLQMMDYPLKEIRVWSRLSNGIAYAKWGKMDIFDYVFGVKNAGKDSNGNRVYKWEFYGKL